MLLVRCHDNSIVTLVSNCHSVSPIGKVEQVGSIERRKGKIQVDCPTVVMKYTKYMGGIDRFDENIDSLRVNLRGKKWWFPLFAFGLDAACHNAWYAYKQITSKSMTYCEFRRNIVQVNCGKFGKLPEKNRINCIMLIEIKHVNAREQPTQGNFL
jgi:hypothetical protein